LLSLSPEMIEQPPSRATQPRGRVALLLSAALLSALLALAGSLLGALALAALISSSAREAGDASSAREAGDATSWYPGKEAKSWYPGKYAALTARTTSSLPTMPSRLESFNQCVSLQHAYFLKLAINDMLATTLWSDLDPGTADASIGLEPQAEPTEITGPPVGKACALACAGEIGGDLRSDWPGAIWSLGGWIGAGNLTALGSSLGSALGGSRCREVTRAHPAFGLTAHEPFATHELTRQVHTPPFNEHFTPLVKHHPLAFNDLVTDWLWRGGGGAARGVRGAVRCVQSCVWRHVYRSLAQVHTPLTDCLLPSSLLRCTQPHSPSLIAYLLVHSPGAHGPLARRLDPRRHRGARLLPLCPWHRTRPLAVARHM